MAEYILCSDAVAVAEYAVDEHPYEKDPKKPETFSEYSRGWQDACDYIRDRLEGLTATTDPKWIPVTNRLHQHVGVWARWRLRHDICDFKRGNNGGDPECILMTFPLFSAMFSAETKINMMQGLKKYDGRFMGVPIQVSCGNGLEYHLCAKNRKFDVERRLL